MTYYNFLFLHKMKEEFIPCIVDKDYEISTTYPHKIRKISNHKIITESIMCEGYVQCYMNCKPYYKHRVIALQFIHNDDPNKTCIDHINRNKSDNRIENLRWVTHSENMLNREIKVQRMAPTYINKLYGNVIEIKHYGDHELKNYYYNSDDDTFYHLTNKGYRKLRISYKNKDTHLGYRICARDTNGKHIFMYYGKLKANL